MLKISIVPYLLPIAKLSPSGDKENTLNSLLTVKSSFTTEFELHFQTKMDLMHVLKTKTSPLLSKILLICGYDFKS